MQHTTRQLSGIGRDVSGSRPTAVHARAGDPTGPRQAHPCRSSGSCAGTSFLGRREGALERPPVSNAANGLASASHYLGLRGASATLALQG